MNTTKRFSGEGRGRFTWLNCLLLLCIIAVGGLKAAAAPSGSVQINGGAAYTASTNVILSPVASGPDVAVRIVVKPPPGTASWGAEELVPVGFSVSEITAPSGVLSGNRVSWYATGANERTVGYKISGPAGQYSLTGEGSFDGANTATMGDQEFAIPGNDEPGPVVPGGPTGLALRTFTGSQVTIQVTPPVGTSIWGAEEYIPGGLTVSNISGPNGVWNATDRKISWGASGATPATLTYQLSVNASQVALNGVVRLGNPAITYPIVGGAGTVHRTIRSRPLQMRFSNDGVAWSTWENLAATFAWTLTPGLGQKTVRAQYRDVAGDVSAVVTANIILDNIAPVITSCASDPGPLTRDALTCQVALPDLTGGVVASDNSGVVTVTQSPVAGTPLGVDTLVTLTVTDPAGNTAACNVTVTVTDDTGPVIALEGDAFIEVECGGMYTDAGATAFDNCDGNLTDAIVVAGDVVNTSVVGTYIITYNVSDVAANAAGEVTREVTVVDTMIPVISLLGNALVIIMRGEPYTDAGANAHDACEGDLTAAIVTDNPVNVDVAGSYVVTYNVTDAEGNVALEETRTVIVENPMVALTPLMLVLCAMIFALSGVLCVGRRSGLWAVLPRGR